MDEERITKRILERLDDLKNKILTNEDLPDGEQDISLLVDINDRLEECLSAWYY